MESWKIKIKSWLQNPAAADLVDVDEETLAPLLLREKKRYEKNCMLIVLPVLTMAEQLAAEMQLWLNELEIEQQILFIPETVESGHFIPENEPKRAQALYCALTEPYDYIILSVAALLSRVPPPRQICGSPITLRTGDSYSIHELLAKLVSLDYDDEFETNVPGEFSRRGGLIDIFSMRYNYPVRVEFFGNEIESIRKFDPKTQRSIEPVTEYQIISRAGVTEPGNSRHDFTDYLEIIAPKTILIFPDECESRLEKFASEFEINKFKRFQEEHLLQRIFRLSADTAGTSVPINHCYSTISHLQKSIPIEIINGEIELLRQLTASRVRQWLDTQYNVILLGSNPDACLHIKQWCDNFHLNSRHLLISVGDLINGVVFPVEKICLLTENELFASNHTNHKALNPEMPATSDDGGDEASAQADLDDGDYAVHITYGIGIFKGIREIISNGMKREVMLLEYKDNALIYVPMWQAGFVSRYIGAQHKVNIHKLGEKKWNETKISAAIAVRSFAADMLRFQAVRNSSDGIKFPGDTLEQRIFEEDFPYNDTPDQKKAAIEIKADMEKSRPMDRLLCGDVGYGKTEVAIRAAFKAVSAGYQVAILVPTTILAQQHYYSFRERFAKYPYVIEMLSRFRSSAEQKVIINRIKHGGIDIIIGTHRLVQNDIAFANLGLVIIDEEQRFGVKHKEKLKLFRSIVDVLTMSATPIPRTLYMAMTGARDLSTIMTAPGSRLPIQTTVAQYDDKLIVEAINNEIRRGGQIFFIHNRVQTIEKTAGHLRQMLPAAAIAVAHGQMDEDELEMIMDEFLNGKINVLVCTTIIESGLDIPNTNTIIIERADRFGLAELYQLRGRVGRCGRQAFAYLLLPRDTIISADARKRLAAIRRYTHLGAGFRLALRDLEIRGAGNLLGAEQSGHIDNIGFDLYCQLLRSEIARMNGRQEQFLPSVDINIDFIDFAHDASPGHLAAGFQPEYIPSERLRIEVYRRLGMIPTVAKLKDFRNEIEDRFGKLNESGINMFKVTEIKILTAAAGYNSINVTDNKISLKNSIAAYRGNNTLPQLSPKANANKKLEQLLAVINKISNTNER
jgi:transcription-repair coupling factor (superfamily II helicase)